MTTKPTPLDPTDAMLAAGYAASDYSGGAMTTIWRAMHEAAPDAPDDTARLRERVARLEAENVLAEIGAERMRQIAVEGWTPEHDDQHSNHEMAVAAACYAAPGARDGFNVGNRPRNKILPFWPWSLNWWRSKDRRSDLVKAAALIVAEIERLDRATARAAMQETPDAG